MITDWGVHPMTKSLRSYVMVTAAALVAIGLVMAILLQRAVLPRPLHRPSGTTVIRQPSAAIQPVRTGQLLPTNIAPMATVSVSSTAVSNGQSGAGVADGVVDRNDWVAQGETSGAWIKLAWERPATIHEIDLFDLPDPNDNVLSGMLIFDDGSTIAVEALPPTGAARRVTFPAKVVRSVMFRIDQAQGPQAGLAEIMVIGILER
jgi:hypothetical protein